MTSRRLRVLIQHLPEESATMTALRNAMPEEELDRLAKQGEPEKARWSRVEQLLALLVDVGQEHKHAFLLANQGKGARKPQRPEPVRRPGVRRHAKQLAPMTDAAAQRLFDLING